MKKLLWDIIKLSFILPALQKNEQNFKVDNENYLICLN